MSKSKGTGSSATGTFLKEDVLASVFNNVFPGTAEQVLHLLISDDLNFRNEYRAGRDVTTPNFGSWHASDEHEGQVREVTYRAKCSGAIGPPTTAVTEFQRYVLSPDKNVMVYEIVQQAHDVPYGSYFEIHCRWSVETKSESSSTVDVKIGAHFKKWCLLQSKIKAKSTDNYKESVELMLKAAPSYIKPIAA